MESCLKYYFNMTRPIVAYIGFVITYHLGGGLRRRLWRSGDHYIRNDVGDPSRVANQLPVIGSSCYISTAIASSSNHLYYLHSIFCQMKAFNRIMHLASPKVFKIYPQNQHICVQHLHHQASRIGSLLAPLSVEWAYLAMLRYFFIGWHTVSRVR